MLRSDEELCAIHTEGKEPFLAPSQISDACTQRTNVVSLKSCPNWSDSLKWEVEIPHSLVPNATRGFFLELECHCMYRERFICYEGLKYYVSGCVNSGPNTPDDMLSWPITSIQFTRIVISGNHSPHGLEFNLRDRVVVISDVNLEIKGIRDGDEVVGSICETVLLYSDTRFCFVRSPPVWGTLNDKILPTISYVISPLYIPWGVTIPNGNLHISEDSRIGSRIGQAGLFLYQNRSNRVLILDMNGVCGSSHTTFYPMLLPFLAIIQRVHGFVVVIWTSSGRPVSTVVSRMLIENNITWFDRQSCVYDTTANGVSVDSHRSVKGRGSLIPDFFEANGGEVIIVDDSPTKWDSHLFGGAVSFILATKGWQDLGDDEWGRTKYLPWMKDVMALARGRLKTTIAPRSRPPVVETDDSRMQSRVVAGTRRDRHKKPRSVHIQDLKLGSAKEQADLKALAIRMAAKLVLSEK